MKKSIPAFISAFAMLILFTSCGKDRDNITVEPVDEVKIGRRIFFDSSLSEPAGQSCATCHSPSSAFSDPKHAITSPGIINGLFGIRNSPSITYAAFTPPFGFNTEDSVWVGGLFLDGRANTLQEQAGKPFFNPLEMNNTDMRMVVDKLRKASYYPLYVRLYGEANDASVAFENMTRSIATFERTRELSPFNSKFDHYLAGKVALSEQEMRGLKLFNDPMKGNCAACHPSTADPNLGKVLFTDFTYDNIGLPKNTKNPFYTIPAAFNPLGSNAEDPGLAGILKDPNFNGHFKVPSLRNIALTAPYGHNGLFKTLEEVVHFYNKRDVEAFPKPEFPLTMNKDELGNLHLGADEEDDIIAFLKTLTDGYK